MIFLLFGRRKFDHLVIFHLRKKHREREHRAHDDTAGPEVKKAEIGAGFA